MRREFFHRFAYNDDSVMKQNSELFLQIIFRVGH